VCFPQSITVTFSTNLPVLVGVVGREPVGWR
jgi:hypothetical protein